jgi:A/G-specific adenine glycosylase
MAQRIPHSAVRTPHLKRLVPLLLDWFAAHARDLPWRHTRDPYAIWVSEIMLQQTQVKTVIPYWNRWMRELPAIESVANASAGKIHKLWEGLGYYTRVRNLQKAAKQIVNRRRDEFHESPFKNTVRDSQSSSLRKKSKCQIPEDFDDVLALPGIGRYTAGAICSIAFNQPTPILDGNVIRVLTRIFDIADDPKETETNALLWELAEELVMRAARLKSSRSSRRKEALTNSDFRMSHLTSAATMIGNCSALNQSLMELGALVCTPRNPQCRICPVKRLCAAFKENRVEELPNLGKRETATARRFAAFIVERNGRFFVRQRPAGVVNAHLWEFPNAEISSGKSNPKLAAREIFGVAPVRIVPFSIVKHSITRYRITLETYSVKLRKHPYPQGGVWKTPAQMQSLAFTSAHRKVLHLLITRDGGGARLYFSAFPASLHSA